MPETDHLECCGKQNVMISGGGGGCERLAVDRRVGPLGRVREAIFNRISVRIRQDLSSRTRAGTDQNDRMLTILSDVVATNGIIYQVQLLERRG